MSVALKRADWRPLSRSADAMSEFLLAHTIHISLPLFCKGYECIQLALGRED